MFAGHNPMDLSKLLTSVGMSKVVSGSKKREIAVLSSDCLAAILEGP